MWGTDYPHPEGTWPHTQERLRGDFGDIPVEDARKLLGETAARCYGFDLEALRPIAEKIGPTPADLGQDASLRTDPEAVRTAPLVEGRVPGAAPGLAGPRRARARPAHISSSPNRLTQFVCIDAPSAMIVEPLT